MDEIPDYESRLDELFTNAFDTNHPAMLDYVKLKMELKRLRGENDRLNDEVSKTHMQVRADYDRTVADCWRQENAKLLRRIEELEAEKSPFWAMEPV
jgi:thymidylate kinase